jgi:hypothetical protein
LRPFGHLRIGGAVVLFELVILFELIGGKAAHLFGLHDRIAAAARAFLG